MAKSILIRSPKNHYLCLGPDELRAVEAYEKEKTGAAVPIIYCVRLHLNEPLELSTIKNQDELVPYVEVQFKTQEEQVQLFQLARALIEGDEEVDDVLPAPPVGSH